MTTISTTPRSLSFRGWEFYLEAVEENLYSVDAHDPEGNAAEDFLTLRVDPGDGTVDVQGGPGYRKFESLAGPRAHPTDGDLGWELTQVLCDAVAGHA